MIEAKNLVEFPEAPKVTEMHNSHRRAVGLMCQSHLRALGKPHSYAFASVHGWVRSWQELIIEFLSAGGPRALGAEVSIKPPAGNPTLGW